MRSVNQKGGADGSWIGCNKARATDAEVDDGTWGHGDDWTRAPIFHSESSEHGDAQISATQYATPR